MKRVIEVMMIASALLILGGCATKKYVAKQTDPITTRVNEVEKQAQNTQKQLEGDEPKISAAAEKADSADARAAAIETARIAFAPSFPLLGVPSSESIVRSIRVWSAASSPARAEEI